MADLNAGTVREAFYAAQSHRPYKLNPDLVKAATPPGGDWHAVALPGAICRSVIWGKIEVAHMNPRGDLDDATEADITMAARALPVMDAALRAIIVLSEKPENGALIRELAASVIAYVEMPAPRISEPDDEEDENGDES